jgi:hypothetical protein
MVVAVLKVMNIRIVAEGCMGIAQDIFVFTTFFAIKKINIMIGLNTFP